MLAEVGQGTTVCLYLPRHAGRERAAAAAEPPAAGAPAAQGETVLIVDDEPTRADAGGRSAAELGYTAIEAEDGAAGLKILQSGGPDRPADHRCRACRAGLNGRQVADAARAIRPELKVLFITGYAEKAVVGHGRMDAGCK